MKCPALLVILYRLTVCWIRSFCTFMNISARVFLLWRDFANLCTWGGVFILAITHSYSFLKIGGSLAGFKDVSDQHLL